MTPTASVPDDPRFPGFPPGVPPEVPPPSRPEVPSPPRPGRPHPGYPPVPRVPMPAPPQPPASEALDDLRSRVYDQLLARRTVVLDRALDGETAMFVAAQLMTLDAEGTGRITLIVNSPGGPLDAAATVLDTIDLVRGPVDTTCLGQAGGTAAVVVAAGTGHRRVGASAQLQLRLPEVELAGTATRVGDEAAHLRRLHDAIVDRLAAATGQDRRLLARDVDRGRVLPARDAVAYGLVDEVIDRSTP